MKQQFKSLFRAIQRGQLEAVVAAAVANRLVTPDAAAAADTFVAAATLSPEMLTMASEAATIVSEVAVNQPVISTLLGDENKLTWHDVVLTPSLDTVIHVAARTAHTHVLRWLMKAGASACLEQRNSDGKRPLHDAAQTLNIVAITLMLHAGACVDPLTRGDWTPLMLASAKAAPAALVIVEALLQAGCDPRLTNKDGWTPVHVCCRSGSAAVAEALLRSHAGAAATVSNNGRTPLHTAAFHDRTCMLMLLHRFGGAGCQRGGDSSDAGGSSVGRGNHEDSDNKLEGSETNAEHFAVIDDDRGVDRERYSVRGDARDSCGCAPVMDALRGGHVETARLLLRLWPDAYIHGCTDILGRGCLQVAAEAGQTEAVRFLLTEHRQDPSDADYAGQTALHRAAREGHAAVLRLLLEDPRCDAAASDNTGRTAACVSRDNNHTACTALLLQHATPQ